MNEFTKLHYLKKRLKEVLQSKDSTFPCELFFNEGFEKPKYKAFNT